MDIRLATPEDASAILDIYAPYINDTVITFEVKVPSTADFSRRAEKIMARFPYIVVERNGRIAGYAYAHPAGEREAYQWNAELSVYVHGDFQRRGLGSRLYSALIELLSLMGYRNLYAVITMPNEASVAMHRRLGFKPLAVHKNAGYKLGKWHDVAWLEKNLGPYGPEPEPPLSINGLAPELIRRILEKA